MMVVISLECEKGRSCDIALGLGAFPERCIGELNEVIVFIAAMPAEAVSMHQV